MNTRPEAPGNGNAVVFPAPPGVEASPDYRVFVQDREVFCYSGKACTGHRFDRTRDTYVFPNTPLTYAIFDIEGRVRVRVRPREGLVRDEAALDLSPRARGIRPRFVGGELEFELDGPGDLSILPNGDAHHALHLLVGAPERDIPDPDDPNVLYYGPGLHDTDSVSLKSGQTLYLAGGAVLFHRPKHRGPAKFQVYRRGAKTRGWSAASVWVRGATNVTVRGRGIISGVGLDPYKTLSRMIEMQGCTNVVVRGVTVVGGNNWDLHFANCENVRVEGARVLGWFANTDGICIDGCRGAVVRDCFVRGYDDGLEVKTMKPGIPCRNVLFENCLMWTRCGAALGVTNEILAPMSDITWRNITITEFKGGEWKDVFVPGRAPIFVHAAYGGGVRNLRFENITIEKCIGRMLYLGNRPAKPRENSGCGIENVRFRNIRADNVTKPIMVVSDESGKGRIKEIVFENVRLNGRPVVPDDERFRLRGGVGVSVK